MKLRIAIWAIAGFLIAGFWALYFLSAHFVMKGAVPVQAQPIAFILARITRLPVSISISRSASFWSCL
jgi:hypothetical protein